MVFVMGNQENRSNDQSESPLFQNWKREKNDPREIKKNKLSWNQLRKNKITNLLTSLGALPFRQAVSLHKLETPNPKQGLLLLRCLLFWMIKTSQWYHEQKSKAKERTIWTCSRNSLTVFLFQFPSRNSGANLKQNSREEEKPRVLFAKRRQQNQEDALHWTPKTQDHWNPKHQ